MPDKAFPLGDVPDYEPDRQRSVAAIAAATGATVDEVYYDLYLERDGRQLVLFTLGGYANRNPTTSTRWSWTPTPSSVSPTAARTSR